MASTKAKQGNEAKGPAGQRFWAEVRGYAEALVIAYLVITFLFNTVGVVGASMRPNLEGGDSGQPFIQALLAGDRVFIPKYDTWLRRAGILGPYSRGDIVVVREPANSPMGQTRDNRPFFIKRVIAIPGDHVRIESGQVYVNGHPVDQGFITDSGEITPDPVHFPVITQRDGELLGMNVGFVPTGPTTVAPQIPTGSYMPSAVPVEDPRVQLYYGEVLASLAPLDEDAPEGEPFVIDHIVPEDHYFVMGDNRESAKGGSEDSRAFGPIDAISVAGKATAVIWPPRRDGDWNWRGLSAPAAFEEIPESPQAN